MTTYQANSWKAYFHRCQAAWTLLAAMLTMSIAVGRASGVECDDLPQNAVSARLSHAFRRAAEQALPALVTIETLSGPRKTIQWAMRETHPSGMHHTRSAEVACPHCPVDCARNGTSSGIIIDRRGFVLTCNHVVAEADTVFVRLQDGRRFEGTDIRTDAISDLAVIRISETGELPEAKLADSDKVALGEWVISVGDPYGLGPSVSAGIVSANDRELPDMPWTRLIQTDAASNPGNSGGALVNLRGEVIGISEGGYGMNAGFQGIGFAIPINDARRIARQLIQHGEVRRSYLGCQTETLAEDISRHLGLRQNGGLIVCDVTPLSPASKAGLETGDVLTKFAGTPIRDDYHLHRLLEEAIPRDHCTITALRDGKTISINVRLERIPDRNDATGTTADQRPTPPSRESDELLGLMLDELSARTSHQLGYEERDHGVLITDVAPRQLAHREGLCAGMIILRVGNHPTPNLSEYRTAIVKQSLEKGVLLLIGTPEGKHFVFLRR